MTINLEILEQLRVIFPSEQFVITGSLAAFIMGVTRKEPKDIDILLINPQQDTVDRLRDYAQKFPKKNKGNYKDEKLFQIFYNDLNIDLFITNEKLNGDLMYNGFIISPLNEIVAAKKRYGNPKHIMQLLSWRSNIITDDEAYKFIRNM